jgi:hypothetical protein
MRNITLKKRDMSMLYEFIMLVAVIAIVAIMVFSINDDARDDFRDGTYNVNCNATGTEGCTAIHGWNGTINADDAVAKVPKSLKLLATAVIFGAVLYVILRVIPVGTGTTFQ